MTFAELKTELLARGFDYLTGNRPARYINQAYSEICEAERWPFLEASASGAAPLTVSDLGAIASVVDTSQPFKLKPVDRRTITDGDPAISQTGAPSWYYVEGGNTVVSWPAGGTLTVRYWKFPAELVADGDTPILPSRFHNAIVDGAARRAYYDDDEPDLAQAVEAERQGVLALMRSSLLDQQHDDDLTIIDHSTSVDW